MVKKAIQASLLQRFCGQARAGAFIPHLSRDFPSPWLLPSQASPRTFLGSLFGENPSNGNKLPDECDACVFVVTEVVARLLRDAEGLIVREGVRVDRGLMNVFNT